MKFAVFLATVVAASPAWAQLGPAPSVGFPNYSQQYSADFGFGASRAGARALNTGYYIAPSGTKLYAGHVYPIAWGQAPLSSGTCYFQSGVSDVGVPTAGSQIAVGDQIAFLGVNGGADFVATVTNVYFSGYQRVAVSPTPAFSSNAACTIVSGPGVFAASDVGSGIGVQYAGGSGAWLNSTISNYISPIVLSLANPASSTALNTTGGEIVIGPDDSAPVNSAIGALLNDASVSRKVLLVNKVRYTPSLTQLVGDITLVGKGQLVGHPLEAWHNVVPQYAPAVDQQPPPSYTQPAAAASSWAEALAAQTASGLYPKILVTAGGTGCTAGTYTGTVSSGGPTGYAWSYVCNSYGSVERAYVTTPGTGGTTPPVLAFSNGGVTGAAATPKQGAISVLLGDSITTPAPDGLMPAGHLFQMLAEKEERDNFNAALTANYAAGAGSFTTMLNRGIGGTRLNDAIGWPLPITIVSPGAGYTPNGGPYAGAASSGPTGFAWSYYVSGGTAVDPYVTACSSLTTCTWSTPALSLPVGGVGQPASNTSFAGASVAQATLPAWYTNLNEPWLDYVERASPDRVYIGFGFNDNSTFSLPALISLVTKLKALSTNPDLIFILQYSKSISSNVNAASALGYVQGQAYAFQSIRHWAQANGYPVIDFYSRAQLVRDGISLQRAALTQDAAVNTADILSARLIESNYTWPTQVVDFGAQIGISGGNWSNCGNEVDISFGGTALPGNTLRIGKDTVSGNFYYQFDTTTTAAGGPIDRTIVAKTVTAEPISSTFWIGTKNGRVTALNSTGGAVFFDGYLETVGGLIQPSFTTATPCRYLQIGGYQFLSPEAFSAVPGGPGNTFMPSANDFQLTGWARGTTVAATLGAPSTTISVSNAATYTLPNINPALQSALSSGGTFPVTVNGTVYQLISATVTNSATGAGTLTFASAVSVTDGTAGAGVAGAYAPNGGDGTHPSTAMGQYVYGPVLAVTNLGSK